MKKIGGIRPNLDGSKKKSREFYKYYANPSVPRKSFRSIIFTNFG